MVIKKRGEKVPMTTVSVYMPHDLWKRLDKHCTSVKRPISQMMVIFTEEKLNEAKA